MEHLSLDLGQFHLMVNLALLLTFPGSRCSARRPGLIVFAYLFIWMLTIVITAYRPIGVGLIGLVLVCFMRV